MTATWMLPLLNHTAFAQDSQPTLPGSAQPGRLNERVQALDSESAQKIIAPRAAAISETIPESADGFILGGISLEGVKAYDENTFTPLINEYVGLKADLDTLNHLANRITARYRKDGYFISRAVVPEQQIGEDRVVRILIIEGFVNDVRFEDPSGLLTRDHFYIAGKTAARISQLSPLHGPSLEKYMLLLNETQGIFVQSILESPSRTDVASGAVNIILKVDPIGDTKALLYNNHGSRFIGPHQIDMQWSTGAFVSALDTLDLKIGSTIPFKEAQFGSLLYKVPLTSFGLTSFTQFTYSNSWPGHTLKTLEVESDATSFKTGMSYSPILSRSERMDVGLYFNLQNSATEFLDQELIDDKTRHIGTNLLYKKSDTRGGLHQATIEIKKGLDTLGATKTGSPNLSRNQGRSDFFVVSSSAQTNIPLEDQWLFSASASAQHAPHPLLSSHEFGYGGTEYGRAYDPSEITGDSGISASVELRYTAIPAGPSFLAEAQIAPFIFYDIGKVWNQEASIKPQSGASAGLGSHFAVGESGYGTVQAAWPLTRKPETPIMNNKNSPRILINFSLQF